MGERLIKRCREHDNEISVSDEGNNVNELLSQHQNVLGTNNVK